MSNYPPGMTKAHYDHVHGVSRCEDCGAELPEEINCADCGTSGVTPPDRFGNRDPCPRCEEARERLAEGYCPGGCYDEPDPDELRDRAYDDFLADHYG